MALEIPNYSTDRSKDIGKGNIDKLKNGEGTLQFTGAYIHLSPSCDYKCEGCFTHMDTDDKREVLLDLHAIKRIIDFVKDRCGQTIVFAGCGEPLLDDNYEEIEDYLKEQRLQRVLFTNLSTLNTKEQALKLLEAGPVIAKLYTLNEKKFDKLTRTPGALKKAMKGIELLLAAKKELEDQGRNVTLGIDSPIMQPNYMDLPDLLRFCRQNDIIPYFEAFIELGQPKEIVDKLALNNEELNRVFTVLQKIDNDEFGITTPVKTCTRNYGQDPCRKATHMFSIRENGDIHLCVSNLRSIGNVFDKEDPYNSLEAFFDAQNKWLIDYFKCDRCSKFVDEVSTSNPTSG
ncbi:radical SAM protein [Patescibacteria group bacterium]